GKGPPFLELDETDHRAFPAILSLVQRSGRAALDVLYARIARHPITSQLLPTQEKRDGASSMQLAHWQKLFSGRMDRAAIARAERIGKVHAD
ncbi:protoglobin domain-containing protein, partial [Streptomyces galilaeus]|uniref:protoglobin domain-containing protein n=1 Tax=Streptomyces galilaeus TaxID=33899 RepID=UPI0038F72F35